MSPYSPKTTGRAVRAVFARLPGGGIKRKLVTATRGLISRYLPQLNITEAAPSQTAKRVWVIETPAFTPPAGTAKRVVSVRTDRRLENLPFDPMDEVSS